MAGVHRAQPRLRPGAVRKVPPGPCVGRRGNACALRALDPSAGAGARRAGDPVPDDRRRRQPRAVDPPLRPPGGEARSARPPHPCRRSVAAPGDERRHRGRPPAPAREPDYLAGLRHRLEHAGGDCRLPAHLLLDDRLRLRARVRAGGTALAPQRGRRRPVPRARRSDQSRRAARAAHAGRGVRTLSATGVSRQDPLLDRRARHARADPRRSDRRRRGVRHPQHPDRDGPPRAAQRDGARAEQAVRADSRRVQGAGLLARLPGGHGVDRRREVSRRRPPRDQGRPGAGRGRLDAAQPEPPRSGRSDRRGHGARGRNGRRRAGRAGVRPVAQPADPDPRRRGVPRPGRRGRDAEPQPAARLPDRRHDPHHRQQPAGVHDEPGRRVQHVVRERAGARVQDPDRPRQCRRSRSVRRSGAAGASRIASGSSAIS